MKQKELETYYQTLLKADLKVLPKKIGTFFDIAGFPHYETVMSNFYSYYFDPNEVHGLKDLFVVSLLELVKQKSDQIFRFSNPALCYSEREVYTTNGKYIDIVIREPSEISGKVENAIIIENKVNALLYNDLIEYYNFIQVNGDKIGIVLSLQEFTSLPPGYINVTHKEFVKQVESSCGPYFMNVDISQMVILKEFLQNIKSMTHSIDLKEHYDFYFAHEEKIKGINELYETIVADIFRQVDEACEMIGLELKLEATYNSQMRNYSSKSAPVYFTIWLDDLLYGDGTLGIYVQLTAEGINNLEKVNKIKFTSEEMEYLDETTKIRKSYLHYATKETKPSKEDIKNLTKYIVEQITLSPLKDIFVKIENCLRVKGSR